MKELPRQMLNSVTLRKAQAPPPRTPSTLYFRVPMKLEYAVVIGGFRVQNQPITLTGLQVDSSGQLIGAHTVTYTWDGSNDLDRDAGGAPIHAATNVSSFSWYVIPGPGSGLSIVVVNLTITVQAYSESQNFIFYPRVNP